MNAHITADEDTDKTNELITATDFNGTHLTITEANITQTIDLSTLTNTGTDDQQLQSFTLNGNDLNLTLEDGGSVAVDLSDLNDSAAIAAVQTLLTTKIDDVNSTLAAHILADLDTNASNELLTDANLSGNTLTLTNADGSTVSVDLSSLDNNATDDQIISSAIEVAKESVKVTLENGGNTIINIQDADSNATNEIQTLTSTNGSVGIVQTGINYDLSVSETTTTVANTIAGHKIADYTNEDGTIVDINETTTVLLQNVSDSLEYQYTNEEATQTVFRASPIVAFGKINADGSPAKIYGATVTRNSKGKYTVTLDTARSSTNYVIQLTIVDSNGAGNDDYDIAYSNQAIDSFIVRTGDNDNGHSDRAQRDSEFMFTVMDY